MHTHNRFTAPCAHSCPSTDLVLVSCVSLCQFPAPCFASNPYCCPLPNRPVHALSIVSAVVTTHQCCKDASLLTAYMCDVACGRHDSLLMCMRCSCITAWVHSDNLSCSLVQPGCTEIFSVCHDRDYIYRRADPDKSVRLPIEFAGHTDTGFSSPGVQTTAAGTFSPLLSVSIGASADSLRSQLESGQYASADAARVGGGLYKHLLQAACTLATDPAPKVATIGKAALRAADVELAPVSIAAGQA